MKPYAQHASHGIFIGFPDNQAGWLFYTESPIGSSHIHVSEDATFDENFDTALVFDQHHFQGSIANRRLKPPSELKSYTGQVTEHHTGSLADFSSSSTPTTPIGEEGDDSDETSDYDPANESNSDTDDDYPHHTAMLAKELFDLTDSPKDSLIQPQKDMHMALSAIQKTTGKPIELYTPEPSSLKAVLCLPTTKRMNG
jgi:hypothetical protein